MSVMPDRQNGESVGKIRARSRYFRGGQVPKRDIQEFPTPDPDVPPPLCNYLQTYQSYLLTKLPLTTHDFF